MRAVPRELLLTGGVPLRPAAAVFEAVAGHLGTLAPRIPDGEQLGWMQAVFHRLRGNEALEAASEVTQAARTESTPHRLFRLRPGRKSADLVLGPNGFADNAFESYRQLRELKAAGIVDPVIRLQVTVPGPGTLAFSVQIPPEELLPVAARALADEVSTIASALPHDEITVQIDPPIEVEHEEHLANPALDLPLHQTFDRTRDQMLASVAALSEAVPADVELGIHICSVWNTDPASGQDNSVLVDFTNALAAAFPRPIGYVHFPIPPEHSAADYEALRALRLGSETTLFLGLINMVDGVEGAKRRLALAQAVVEDFGVAFWCGLGYAPRPGDPSDMSARVKRATSPFPALAQPTAETVGEVLDLHRQVAQLGMG
jgi:hypothetical protein